MPTKAAALRRDVVMAFGPASLIVNVYSARAARQSDTMVCCGSGDAEHAPSKIEQRRTCPTCKEVNPATQLARPVDGGYVLVAKTQPEPSDPKSMPISAHPMEQIDGSVLVGGGTYYLTPSSGSVHVYAAVQAAVESAPQMAFLTRWAPRGNQKNYWLTTLNGTLALMELTAENFRTPPDFIRSDADTSQVASALIGYMATAMRDFDLNEYAEQSTAPTTAAPEPVAAPQGDPFAALYALLAQ